MSEEGSDCVLSSESATSDGVSEYVSQVVFVSDCMEVLCLLVCVYHKLGNIMTSCE